MCSLQQQYREKGFTKYSELISCLLIVEQNNELLLKNHESRWTGSVPFPKLNVATRNHYNHEPYCGRSRGRIIAVVVDVDVDVGVDIMVVVLRIYLSTRSGKIVKKNLRKKIVGKLANMWRLHAIIVVEKVIPVVCQSILLTLIKNH
ncbi:UNVERIFIED_CONTAM: hypothetical protein Sradi_6111600 [Sesamum radiatum]|uniref:Uncharacterized protein n=1 Tax=Sesamum radiatum TaxID=300843 RepID=A0AAW2KKH1_SESRA